MDFLACVRREFRSTAAERLTIAPPRSGVPVGARATAAQGLRLTTRALR